MTHIRRLTTFRDGQRRDTDLLVLTFNTTSLPETLNIGWLRKDVRVFIPNPLRCYNCQRFGHGSSTCKYSARCFRCGQAPHGQGVQCTGTPICLSCDSSEHLVSSSQCPVWKEEKSICELKANSGMSYPEARRQVKATKVTPTPGKSYAQAAKVQTASSSTQTEPISALPPLQLLKPVAPPQTTQTTKSNASTEPMTTDSEEHSATPSQSTDAALSATPTQDTSVSPVVARTSHGRQPPGIWSKVPGRPKNTNPCQKRDSAIPYSRLGNQPQERQSRTPVKIAMGRARSLSLASPSRGARLGLK